MDPDPEGPKTCGSGGSGSGSATLDSRTMQIPETKEERGIYEEEGAQD